MPRGVPTTPLELGVPRPAGRGAALALLAPTTPAWLGRAAAVRPAAGPSLPTTVPLGIREPVFPPVVRCGVPPMIGFALPPAVRPVAGCPGRPVCGVARPAGVDC